MLRTGMSSGGMTRSWIKPYRKTKKEASCPDGVYRGWGGLVVKCQRACVSTSVDLILYIFIHTYTFETIYIQTHTYIYIYKHTNTYTHTQTYIHVHSKLYTYYTYHTHTRTRPVVEAGGVAESRSQVG